MPLSWNEIKERAVKFSQDWKYVESENAEAKPFLEAFFDIFGITRRKVATFEHKVKKLNEHEGYIDLFWKGTMLVEMKSKGKDLEKAFQQAKNYTQNLKQEEIPKYILVSDFETFKLFDLLEDKSYEFKLSELVNNIQLFGFIAGYQKKVFIDQDPVNIQAAMLMGKIHDRLKEIGYVGHPLEVYLVRMLFCLFAEDTGIFEKQLFQDYIEQRTNIDGSDLAAKIQELFQVLNTPKSKRFTNIDEQVNEFPFVNGNLFQENLPVASFDSKMRKAVLDCCYFDWSEISPAIFGAMFQSVMNPELRRNLGAHYTSEKNILKVIQPLFLDELNEEFEFVKGNRNKLVDFHKKLANLRFLDPACGCGNFLVIAYREIRLLEVKVLKILNEKGQGFTDIKTVALVDVDQMYGIEIVEFPARIAEVALWLIDHQMNMKISEEFGQYFLRLPLQRSANIINKNALIIDWNSLLKPRIIETYFYDMGRKEAIGKIEEIKLEFSYILGNPPFVGKQVQSQRQKEDIDLVFNGVANSGILDYVSCWYKKSAELIQDSKIKVSFVSTNSITQGEQVGILWNELFFKHRIKIHFAHRTFKWSNEAKGVAAVHCVIIGFASYDVNDKKIFDYDDIRGEPHEVKVSNINPYLVDAKDIVITNRTKPICDVPEIIKGSETTDNGHFMLTIEEVEFLKHNFPISTKYIRPFIGGGDFINGKIRYCLWLKDADSKELRSIPLIMEKIGNVKQFRLSSNKERTKKWAMFPTLFSEDRQPITRYLVFPKVSSERRNYIPFAYMEPEYIINNTASYIPEANLYIFGVLQSYMHVVWIKNVCGRLESRFIYSNKIVYNNFPWPSKPTEKQIQEVEKSAQAVLDVRKEFPNLNLAELYDPLTMPVELVKTHQTLDKIVDRCYRSQPFQNESKRMEFLFELYETYTKPLIGGKRKSRKK
ncbi:MAG: class I SAM-dependent DNA methyltransferase [Leptospiraceae bacterium]|nr:class I SAM-dependent DNA methyltransferase [Leptospiraceae bacterium]